MHKMIGLDFETRCYNKMFWLSPNPFFASLIKKLYANDDGEVASFLQFSYQSFLLVPYGEKVGKVFESIAQDELSHIKKLGEAIVMLGEKPEYKFENKYFSGRTIKTENNINLMLINDIEQKENSIINYKTTISKIDNKYLKNLLNSILIEETYHLNGLKNCVELIKN